MSWKKEPCRNFQRGSCRYGDKCKFLHVTQPQSKPSPLGFGTGSMTQSLNTRQPNPIGFGTGNTGQQQRQQQQPSPFGFGTGTTSQQQRQQQQPNPFGFGTGVSNQQLRQQQQPNPFGFGVQSGQRKGASPFAARRGSDYQQPFGNKWIRSVNAPPAKQSESQPRTVTHRCDNPNECKRLIVEDLANERPLWILTCYGHFKGLPCDIHGDISYEELRAAAYDDARRGLSLQSIVERERNLLNSKLIEFDKLLRSPYAVSQTQTTAVESPFSNQNISPASAQNVMALQAFSHCQSTCLPSSNIGQPSPFQDYSQVANGNGMMQESPGFLGDYSQKPPGGSSGPNVGFAAAPSSSTMSQHSNMLGGSGTVSLLSSVSLENKGEIKAVDAGIWLQEKWRPKEIPEEEPPSKYCFD